MLDFEAAAADYLLTFACKSSSESALSIKLLSYKWTNYLLASANFSCESTLSKEVRCSIVYVISSDILAVGTTRPFSISSSNLI